jgi:low temperature requirement protein LtrA
VGRNLGGMVLLRPTHPLGETFLRLTVWSLLAGALWLAGALLSGNQRILLWGPALLIELAAPLVWYWVPARGRLLDIGHPVKGSHFAERCQGFIIIALGESIVVTGATAAHAGLSAAVVGALAVASWRPRHCGLYFGEVAIHSRRYMQTSEDSVALARDACTYLHLPIVAGIILVAVGSDYLTADPSRTLSSAQAAITLAGPVLYLAGETLFRIRMIGSANPKRFTTIVVLLACGLIATNVSAVVLGLIITAILTSLAIWEYEPLWNGSAPVLGAERGPG